MEMKSVTSLEELENIREKHAIIVVSDGKIQVGELPAYGDVQIVCKDKKAKRIKVQTETQL